MASFTERIRLVFDVDNKGALSGFAGFRKSIADADGVTGKFKAGLGSLKAGFGQFMTSGTGMATVATAGAAALMKAVDASQDLALEVGKLADATGMSTEAASRWVEVAGDVGVSSDQIAGLIQKLTKNLGDAPEKFKAFGVEVQHTADGAVDMNATLLSAIDVLNKTTDPTKRAALAQKLFGKSWAEASELITMGADNLQARLKDVSGAKIMSPEQIKQAREFRDAMDNLKDISEDLMLTVGKTLVPVLTDLAEVLGDVTDVTGGVSDALDSLTGGTVGLTDVLMTSLTGGIWPLYRGLKSLHGAFSDFEVQAWTDAWEQYTEQIAKGKAETEAASGVTATFAQGTEEAGHALHDLQKEEAAAAAEARGMAMAARDARQGLADLQAQIAGERSFVELAISLHDNAAALADLDQKFKDGEISASDYYLAVQSQTLATKDQVAGYIAKIGTIPPELATNIIANIDPRDQAKLDRMLLVLQQIEALHATNIGGILTGSSVRNLVEGRASGGPVRAGTPYVVGENRPELFVPSTSGTILPSVPSGGAGATYNITVNTLKADADIGRVVVDAINAHTRNGGQGPR